MEAAYLKVYGTTKRILNGRIDAGFAPIVCREFSDRFVTGVNAADAMVEYAVQKAKAGNPKRP